MRLLKHLKAMNNAGWQCNYLSEYATNPLFPMASFYVYFPSNNSSLYAGMTLDNFMGIIGNELPKFPDHILDPTVLASALCEYTCSSKIIANSDILPGLLAAYMATTLTGREYFNRHIGRPFHFICIMYPASKKQTAFHVRPFLSACQNDVLSVNEIKDACQGVMSHDRQQGKKEYFRYLK